MTNDKDQIPQRELGTTLRSFFDHVTSHDEEGVHAALCMVANADPENSSFPTKIKGITAVPMHICSFGSGNPDALAQMTIMAIDSMIEEIPGFTEAWEKALRAKSLQSMVNQVLDVVQQVEEQAAEAKGMEAAKPTVDALIEKLKTNTKQ